MPTVSTFVAKTGEPQFDMNDKFIGYGIIPMDEKVSHGLVSRLRNFAIKRFEEAGFSVETWQCDVMNYDAEEQRSDRRYYVSFTNQKGGVLTLNEIMMKNGWPTHDHGFSVSVA
jgi:hypothetical protein